MKDIRILFSNLLSVSKNSNRKISIIAYITIIVLMTDMLLGTFFDVLRLQLISGWGIVIFTAIVMVLYGIGQYFLMKFAKMIIADLKTTASFGISASLISISQYTLLTIFLLIVLQMIFTSHYYMGMIIVATAIGTIPGSILLGLLGYRLISWYKSNTKNVMILFLGLGAALGGVAASGNIIIMFMQSEWPIYIGPYPQVYFQEINSSKTLNIFFYAIVFETAIVSTIFEWVGVALLLRNFSKKIGILKYWIIVCLPFLSFLGGIAPTLLTQQSSFDYVFYSEQKLFFRIITIFSVASIAFIVGFAYWTIARSIRQINQESILINYMTITAFGIILVHLAYTAPVVFPAYPPFGAAGHSFLTLASYLFSLGYYFSAISVSQDMNLRKSIRKFALEESKLLDSIGTAAMEQKIQKEVLTIAKANSDAMTKETGIEPSLSDEDVKQYLDQVLKEISKTANANYMDKK